MVGRPVVGAEPRAVEAESDGQLLEADVVHCAVIGALHKSGINRGDGPETLARHARSENRSVLLGDSNVKKLRWQVFFEEG